METINSILSGIICPAALIIFGIYFAARLRFFFILHPIRMLREIKSCASDGGASPFKSLSMALAGTLGVGNMAGVATALTAGGAGALLWMLIGAFCAMSVKYIEVMLAMKTRERTVFGWRGGAMYYIKKISAPLASVFAVLCAANSLLTGNIVQVKAAASVFDIPPICIGIGIGLAALIVAFGGGKRIADTCAAIIPLLSVVYVVISCYIICSNISRLPEVVREIFISAFSLESVGGGLGGYAVMRAVRFGVTRGIFSNEAGCGTSPAAHAMSETERAHGQACLGIAEVFIDTVLLCTLTGFVILLSGCDGDGISLTVGAYSTLAGAAVGRIIGASVILFAFSTVICQASYGIVSVEYLGLGKAGNIIFLLLTLACSIIGSVIDEGVMWQVADLAVSLMTVINVGVILMLTKGKYKYII